MRNSSKTLLLFNFFVCLFWSCKGKVDYYKIPAFRSQKTVNAIVEISSGTSTKFEYDHFSKKFVIDQENGVDRIIEFLPYPANYGFVPSTVSGKEIGGDGDALDILIISKQLKKGTVVEVIPIAMLKLIDEGEIDHKIVAIPYQKEYRTINAASYIELLNDYPSAIQIIELWFLNYNKKDNARIEGWGNEYDAIREIKKSLKE
ncbi:inorganic diphosphatase [Flagellimonas onchidii]|uniref:inorganic diphosphatase n=1 Tax=Flagellimonas onchidii TaxID=2562684 RepID=UPI0010A5E960|nr:inorganic diphosphatase [Allomuricauda onchidii]